MPCAQGMPRNDKTALVMGGGGGRSMCSLVPAAASHQFSLPLSASSECQREGGWHTFFFSMTGDGRGGKNQVNERKRESHLERRQVHSSSPLISSSCPHFSSSAPRRLRALHITRITKGLTASLCDSVGLCGASE